MSLAKPRPAATGQNYVQFQHQVLRDTTLRPGARLLYAIVQARAWKTGWCLDSHATLAEDYGCSERQIARLLDALVDAEILLVRNYARGHGQAKAYAPVAGLDEDDVAALDARLSELVGRTRASLKVTMLSPLGRRRQSTPLTEMSPKPEENVAANPTVVSPVKEDPVKDLKTGSPDVSGSGVRAAAAGKPTTPIRPELSAGARAVVAWWRECNDEPEPTLNTAQARMIERAVEAFGVEHVKSSVEHLAEKGVSGLNNAITGAYTRAQRGAQAPAAPPRSAAPPPRPAPASPIAALVQSRTFGAPP